MSKLEIRLLGRLSVAAENAGEFALPRKNKVMLAALALAGPGGLSREKLVDLLWGDRDEKRAHASLRQALAATRKGLGPYRDCLRAEPEQISIDGAMIELDAREFEALASSEAAGDRDRALALYQGDLLDGIRLKEEAFEAWSRPLRERLRTKAITLLSESLDSACDAERCVASASRLLELEATNEAAHRALMRTYAAQGRDNAALKQFIVCRDLLDHELGIGPSRQTIALFEEIRGKRRLLAGRKRSGGARIAVVAPKATTVERPRPTTKPSIAVLPFTNMSGDAEQEYFSDGITEDIITGLSKNPDLFVISRHSAFAFKGRSLKLKDISRELGVRYVLEGSIRKAGQRIRVTAQLIDATTDRHLWAERYDREMGDIFAVQDEIVGNILHNVGAAGGKLEQSARAAAMQKDTNSLRAYDYYLRGKEHVYRYRDEGFAEARELYEKAIELDPEFARAHSALAFMYTRWINFGPENPVGLLAKALELARRAVHLDPSDYRAHWTLGSVYLFDRRQHAQSIAEFERAKALNPNDAGLLAHMVDALTYVGRSEDAVELAKEVIRRNPNSPVFCFRSLAAAYYLLHRYDDALATLQKIAVPLDARRQFAITYAQLGRLEEARAEANEFLKIYPSFSIQRWAKTEPYANPEDLEHHIDGLRKAGLPE